MKLKTYLKELQNLSWSTRWTETVKHGTSRTDVILRRSSKTKWWFGVSAMTFSQQVALQSSTPLPENNPLLRSLVRINMFLCVLGWLNDNVKAWLIFWAISTDVQMLCSNPYIIPMKKWQFYNGLFPEGQVIQLFLSNLNQ